MQRDRGEFDTALHSFDAAIQIAPNDPVHLRRLN